MMSMPQVASDFARAVIERKHAQAYAFTTRGLQTRMSLEEFVHALENAEREVVPPGTFGLSGNSMTFEELADFYQEEGTPFRRKSNPRASGAGCASSSSPMWTTRRNSMPV